MHSLGWARYVIGQTFTGQPRSFMPTIAPAQVVDCPAYARLSAAAHAAVAPALDRLASPSVGRPGYTAAAALSALVSLGRGLRRCVRRVAAAVGAGGVPAGRCALLSGVRLWWSLFWGCVRGLFGVLLVSLWVLLRSVWRSVRCSGLLSVRSVLPLLFSVVPVLAWVLCSPASASSSPFVSAQFLLGGVFMCAPLSSAWAVVVVRGSVVDVCSPALIRGMALFHARQGQKAATYYQTRGRSINVWCRCQARQALRQGRRFKAA